MSEPTKARQKTVICNWCGETVRIKVIQYHFRIECKQCPPTTKEQKVCSVCQKALPISDFCISVGHRGGLNTTCNSCNAERVRQWREMHPKAYKEPRTKRPLGWILRPCPYCSEEFGARALSIHKPRCPKKPADIAKPRGFGMNPELRVESQMSETYTEALRHRNEKRNQKDNNLRFHYGITVDDWESLLREQGGVCAICRRLPVGQNRRTDSFHVDHDHATGRVRGLLCHLCNMAIGHFREDVGLLLAAVDYLMKYRPVQSVS